MTFDEIKRAIVAKTKNKNNMPNWYYKRLEKCIPCEYNSGNQEKLSLKDRIRISHNFGKDSCLKCTCGIEDISSDPIEQCSLPEPKWIAISSNSSDVLNLLSKSNNVNFGFDKNSKKYIVGYGVISRMSDSTVIISIESKNISELTIKSSCGCTVGNVNENNELQIRYDTKRLGAFSKNITLKYKDRNISKQTIITITGFVK